MTNVISATSIHSMHCKFWEREREREERERERERDNKKANFYDFPKDATVSFCDC